MILDAYLTLTLIPYRSQKENEKGLDLSSLASSTMRFPRTEILDGELVGLTHPNQVGPNPSSLALSRLVGIDIQETCPKPFFLIAPCLLTEVG